MSQFDFGTINPNTKSGTQLASDLNDFRDALNSLHKGNSRPSYAQAGTLWINDTTATAWLLRLYDGTDDITLATINTSANTITFAGVLTASDIGVTVQPADPVLSGIAGDEFPLAGFENLIINARGQINQRGYSSGAATSGANEYTIDRWRVVVSGQSLSWTESGGTKTFTAPAGGVEQVIEGANIVSGTYVLSYSGTATCTIDSVAKASGDTVTLTGGVNSTIKFTGGTFSLPQLRPGSVARPFERRPIGIERVLCHRYYRRWVGTATSSWPIFLGWARGATVVRISVPLDVPLRTASPTVSFANLDFNNGSGALALGAGVWLGTADVCAYQFTCAGATLQDVGDVGSNGSAAYFALDSEL